MGDWAGGRLSARRLLSLIANITPEGTAWSRVLSKAGETDAKPKPPPDWWWTPERDFLATLVDLKRGELWAHADPSKRGPFPEPIDRPSVRASKRSEPDVDPAVALALLRRHAPVPAN